MLERLTIKNYILVRDIEINFSPGFNVITGETGTGKSIILNAISLLTGERADYSAIRTGCDKMYIEGHILSENKLLGKLISEIGAESMGDRIIIRRELYSKAYSRNFINDSPVPISYLQKLGDLLIDIHSQNEHQSLLKKDTHLEFIDDYISSVIKDYKNKIIEYFEKYEKFKCKEKEIRDIIKKKEEYESRKELLQFQLKEIQEINPVEGEDEIIEKDLRIAENLEGIKTSIENSINLLYDESGSVIEKIRKTEKELLKIKEFDKEIEEIYCNIGNTGLELNEMVIQLRAMLENVKSRFNPEDTEIMRERLGKLQFLKKKYGSSLDEVIKLKKTLEDELINSESFSDKVNSLEEEIEKIKKELYEKADEISLIRKKECEKMDRKIEKVLSELGLGEAGFKTYLRKKDELDIKGRDDAEFLVSLNKGSEYTPLRKTASGGEVSRIMLAIKSVLAEAGTVEILVFDEIDTGISGRIALKTGKIIKKLSQAKQIIAVTHLAQIAALSEKHFVVEKVSTDNSPEMIIRSLNKEEKVMETARLISGEKITETSIKSARELMNI